MPGGTTRLSTRELETESLYGSMWPEFDDDLFDQSVELFAARLDVNGFDLDWFEGKRCLDAGCGGGRYSIAMSQLGASEVVGVDISTRGLAQAKLRVAQRGIANIGFQESSVLDLPFDDATFDFACSNGVLHHTEDPYAGIAELRRVLKPGGKLFLYVFGEGGIFWRQVDVLRDLLHEAVGIEFARDMLRMMGIPANRQFNFLDMTYVPIQHRFTKEGLAALLNEAGFGDVEWMSNGIAYDTNKKIAENPRIGGAIFGEGDLRVIADVPFQDEEA